MKQHEDKNWGSKRLYLNFGTPYIYIYLFSKKCTCNINKTSCSYTASKDNVSNYKKCSIVNVRHKNQIDLKANCLEHSIF